MQVVVFTGGGTGGHVYPGLAVLEALRQNKDFKFVWIGSKDGIEHNLVTQGEYAQWGIDYYAIDSGKLRRYFDWKNFTDLVKIIRGYFQARKILKKLKPVFVFSKGGFVSVPPVRAANSLKIPVFSHESDSDPGLATKLNMKASRKIFIPYEESLKFFPPQVQSKLVVSGNPIRSDFSKGNAQWVKKQFAISEDLPVVFVCGGSLGAVQVNEMVSALLPRLVGKAFVIHQTGKEWTAQPDTPWYVSRPYFHEEMPHLYASADLLIGRAGAGTLWEAAGAGVPLYLIPLSAGSRGDQVRNAELFSRLGAAEVWKESDGISGFIDKVLDLLDHPQKRSALKNGLLAFHAGEAAQTITKTILQELLEDRNV